MNEIKMGVFLCECGDQISSTLDMESLEKQVREHPLAKEVRKLRYACSPDGLATIQMAIQENGLDGVVIAGCTPRTMAHRFREAFKKAELEFDRLELVDIREGCAWVHSATPQAATDKAINLIRMGIVRAAWRQPPHTITLQSTPSVLVIGGGLSGMTAALILANAGVPVKLVEQEATLGGILRQVHTLFPDHRNAACYLADKVDSVSHNAQIELLLQSQVTAISANMGQYRVNIGHLHASGEGDEILEVGAIIVATGARILSPHGVPSPDGRRVVTQWAFEKELIQAGNGSPGDNWPHSVVMLLCPDGHDGYQPDGCTGLCCMTALEQAIDVKVIQPHTDVTILYHELHLPNGDDYLEEFRQARKLGVEFVHFAPTSYPEVNDEFINVNDGTNGITRNLPYDRLVLTTPLAPQSDANAVARILKLPQDENGFFFDRRLRLRPHEHYERGIYVCGAAHYPTSWQEAEFQAASAALNAIRHIRSSTVERRISTAYVDEERCTGCGTCIDQCPLNAISMYEQEGVLDVAKIDPTLCVACGNCVVICPAKAIHHPLEGDEQILAEIEEALTIKSSHGQHRVLVFCCEWSGQIAADIAGARKLLYPPEMRPIHMSCSARFDPIHALWGFLNGADGILVTACPPGHCHYINGNRHASERIDVLRTLLTERGFDSRRMGLTWIKPDNPQEFVSKITAFTELVKALGPSSHRKP